MKRRAALSALIGIGTGAAAAVAAPGPLPRHASPVPASGLLVWGAAGLWVGDEGSELRRLPLDVDRAPVPVVGGLCLLQGRQLHRWQHDGQGAWQVAAGKDFDEAPHALAASPDGRHLLVAHGERLSLLDGDAVLLRRYDGTDLGRRRRGAAQALFHLGSRRSFVAAWPALGEIWEIPLDPAAPPIYDGLVHDYRMGEAIPSPGHLGIRRVPLEMPMADVVYADDRLPWIAGQLGDEVQIVHLDVRRRIASWRQPGASPQAAQLRRQGGASVWWLPVADAVQLVDAARWQALARIEAPGTVHALQTAGDAVWALCGEGAAAMLVVWRADAWAPMRLPAGAPCALQADGEGRRLLVATTGPSRVYLLDGDGQLRRHWTLPDDVTPRQVRWLPRAA